VAAGPLYLQAGTSEYQERSVRNKDVLSLSRYFETV
jgi:hypothetical protein